MEQTYKALSREFDRLADLTEREDRALRRAYFAEKNARTGDTARDYTRLASELRSQMVTCRIEIRRLLNRTYYFDQSSAPEAGPRTKEA